MLFTIAQSAAPTRAASPDANGQDCNDGEREDWVGGGSERHPMPMRSALSSRRRVEYLKNYVGQVAPWVSGSIRQTKVDACSRPMRKCGGFWSVASLIGKA